MEISRYSAKIRVLEIPFLESTLRTLIMKNKFVSKNVPFFLSFQEDNKSRKTRKSELSQYQIGSILIFLLSLSLLIKSF